MNLLYFAVKIYPVLRLQVKATIISLRSLPFPKIATNPTDLLPVLLARLKVADFVKSLPYTLEEYIGLTWGRVTGLLLEPTK